MRIEDTRMARLCAAFTLTVLGLSCGGSAPSGPSSQPPPATVAPPTLSGVTPAIGATSGGLGVTITGTGFTAGATVSIGGAAATSVAVASATSITASTPPHAAGSADVVVTNPDGQSGRLAGAFNYETPGERTPGGDRHRPVVRPCGRRHQRLYQWRRVRAGRHGLLRHDTGRRGERRERDDDHGHGTGRQRRQCRCRRDECRWSERAAVARVHLRRVGAATASTAGTGRALAQRDRADLDDYGRRRGSHADRIRILGGGDRVAWRHRGLERRRRKRVRQSPPSRRRTLRAPWMSWSRMPMARAHGSTEDSPIRRRRHHHLRRPPSSWSRSRAPALIRRP